MSRHQTPKPEQTSFLRFYLLDPVSDLGAELADVLQGIWHRLCGAWWCDHCQRYHGRRVKRWDILHSSLRSRPCISLNEVELNTRSVCSLGFQAHQDELAAQRMQSQDSTQQPLAGELQDVPDPSVTAERLSSFIQEAIRNSSAIR